MSLTHSLPQRTGIQVTSCLCVLPDFFVAVWWNLNLTSSQFQIWEPVLSTVPLACSTQNVWRQKGFSHGGCKIEEFWRPDVWILSVLGVLFSLTIPPLGLTKGRRINSDTNSSVWGDWILLPEGCRQLSYSVKILLQLRTWKMLSGRMNGTNGLVSGSLSSF